MTDNRRRVYEEAKERGLSSDALVKILREAGCEVKSHMSLLTDEMVVSLNKRFEAEKELAKADFERRKQVAEDAARAAAAGPAPGGVATPTMIAAALTEAGVLAANKARRKHKGPRALGSLEVELEELNPEALAAVAKEAAPRTAPAPGSSGKFQKFKATPKAQDKKAIQENVKKTLAQLEAGRKVRRYAGRRDRDLGPAVEGEENVLRVAEYISVSDLAMLMDLKPSDIIGKCLSMGMMTTINQRLDFDTIELVAHELGFKAIRQEEFVATLEEEEETDPHLLRPRPPIVTIMGHVDHGKTSLLDVIRSTNVVAGEAGGITQHIGAYEVETPGGAITFLDTPGHEAFTAMRARGAQVTDIVVIVVAANDGVQPQTIEAIDHARAAGVPIIVAINKIDIPGASPDQVKAQLAQHNVQVESWGGNVQCIEVSARQNLHTDKLLDAILLQAEILDLKANPDGRAKGTIIEAKLDRGRGPTATVLITSGTLKIGDPFVTGSYSGRIRAMYDERGKPIKDAPPSTPAQIVGLPGVPQAGDAFFVTESDAEAKDIASVREQLRREEQRRRPKRLALTDVYTAMREAGLRELRLIIKADVDGSIEVLRDTV